MKIPFAYQHKKNDRLIYANQDDQYELITSEAWDELNNRWLQPAQYHMCDIDSGREQPSKIF